MHFYSFLLLVMFRFYFQYSQHMISKGDKSTGTKKTNISLVLKFFLILFYSIISYPYPIFNVRIQWIANKYYHYKEQKVQKIQNKVILYKVIRSIYIKLYLFILLLLVLVLLLFAQFILLIIFYHFQAQMRRSLQQRQLGDQIQLRGIIQKQKTNIQKQKSNIQKLQKQKRDLQGQLKDQKIKYDKVRKSKQQENQQLSEKLNNLQKQINNLKKKSFNSLSQEEFDKKLNEQRRKIQEGFQKHMKELRYQIEKNKINYQKYQKQIKNVKQQYRVRQTNFNQEKSKLQDETNSQKEKYEEQIKAIKAKFQFKSKNHEIYVKNILPKLQSKKENQKQEKINLSIEKYKFEMNLERLVQKFIMKLKREKQELAIKLEMEKQEFNLKLLEKEKNHLKLDLQMQKDKFEKVQDSDLRQKEKEIRKLQVQIVNYKKEIEQKLKILKSESKKQQEKRLTEQVNKIQNNFQKPMTEFVNQGKKCKVQYQQLSETIEDFYKHLEKEKIKIIQQQQKMKQKMLQFQEMKSKNQKHINQLNLKLEQKTLQFQEIKSKNQKQINQLTKLQKQKQYLNKILQKERINLQREKYQFEMNLQMERKDLKIKLQKETEELKRNQQMQTIQFKQQIQQLNTQLQQQKQKFYKEMNENQNQLKMESQKNCQLKNQLNNYKQEMKKINQSLCKQKKQFSYYLEAKQKQLELLKIQIEQLNLKNQEFIKLKSQQGQKKQNLMQKQFAFQNSNKIFAMKDILTHAIQVHSSKRELIAVSLIYKYEKNYKEIFSKKTINKQNLLIIAKTINEQIIGGFTSQGFGNQSYYDDGYGFLFSTDKFGQRNFFDLKSSQKTPSQCLKTEIRFGYRQLIIKNGNQLQTDFATPRHQSRGHYLNKNKITRQEFVISNSKEFESIQLIDYEIYQLTFDNQIILQVKDHNQILKKLKNAQNQTQMLKSKIQQNKIAIRVKDQLMESVNKKMAQLEQKFSEQIQRILQQKSQLDKKLHKNNQIIMLLDRQYQETIKQFNSLQIKLQNQRQQIQNQRQFNLTQIKSLKLKFDDKEEENSQLNDQIKKLNQHIKELKNDEKTNWQEKYNQIAMKYQEKEKKDQNQLQEIRMNLSNKTTEFEMLIQEKKKQLIKIKQRQLSIVKQDYMNEIQKINNKLIDLGDFNEYLKIQNNNFKKKINQKDQALKEIQKKSLKNKVYELYFQGDVFDSQPYEQLVWFVDQLQKHCEMRIRKTRLLYRKDDYNKVNFHEYFDKLQDIVLIIKLKNGIVLAGYTHPAFIKDQKLPSQNGFIFSFNTRQVFSLKKEGVQNMNPKPRSITYDENYIIFGNNQIRLRFRQDMIFSNFGSMGTFYDNKKQSVDCLFGQKNRESQMLTYQIFQVKFEI